MPLPYPTCPKEHFHDTLSHCFLKIIARDFSCFVTMTMQFGGAIRDVNLKHVCSCLLMGISATV